MRVIGLIGGMSWSSTVEYYRIINQLVTEKLGRLHSARLVLYSLDFEEVEKAQREARWDDATDILTEAAMAIKAAGADFLVLCANTMHKVAEAVVERANLPLLHIGDAVGEALREQGIRKAGLLGTRFVMEEPFYRNRLEELYGIEVVVPEEEGRSTINRIIYDELCREIIEPASRRACLKVISGLVEQEVEGIILGCTELPLLIRQDDLTIHVFDSTRLHAEAAVNRALSET